MRFVARDLSVTLWKDVESLIGAKAAAGIRPDFDRGAMRGVLVFSGGRARGFCGFCTGLTGPEPIVPSRAAPVFFCAEDSPGAERALLRASLARMQAIVPECKEVRMAPALPECVLCVAGASRALRLVAR